MKKGIIILMCVVCLFGCKKSPKQVSAKNGCVTCHTNDKLINTDGSLVWERNIDTTICSVPDSILSAYLKMGNITNKGNYTTNYATEKAITTCN